MTSLRAYRSLVISAVLLACLMGVKSTMPVVLADCGNQQMGGGCSKDITGAATDPVDAPWWEDLADLVVLLLPSLGE